MKGEDPRLITTIDPLDTGKQKLWVVYCKRHQNKEPELRMAYTQLILLENKLQHEVRIVNIA